MEYQSSKVPGLTQNSLSVLGWTKEEFKGALKGVWVKGQALELWNWQNRLKFDFRQMDRILSQMKLRIEERRQKWWSTKVPKFQA